MQEMGGVGKYTRCHYFPTEQTLVILIGWTARLARNWTKITNQDLPITTLKELTSPTYTPLLGVYAPMTTT